MNPYLLLIILAVLIIILVKVVKNILITSISILLIVIIALAGISYFTYKDINSIKNNIDRPNIIVIEENERPIVAVSLNKEKIKQLNEKGIEQIKNKNYKIFLKEHFKIFFIDIKTVKNLLPEEININNIKIKKQLFIELLNSKDPLEHKALAEYRELIKDGDTRQTKIFLLSLAAQNIKELKTEDLLKEYKKGNIKVYKETITFKIIKFMPESFLKKISSLS